MSCDVMKPFQRSKENTEVHTVYLIDKDGSARRGLANLLTMASYNVESFTSVTEFFQNQSTECNSCMVVDPWEQDVSMEDLQTKLLTKNVHIPIIFLSAGADKKLMDRAIQLNAAGFFHKPVDGLALIDAISWEIEKCKDIKLVQNRVKGGE